MSIELHNFIWEEVRLVQVETQSHHIAGVLANIRETLENLDCEWEDIYSAYYDCEEDATTTFYEGESAEADNPGIWTYVIYDCTPNEEEVVTNLDINTLEPALKLRRIIVEVLAVTTINSLDEQVYKLQTIARENGIFPEALISSKVDILQENEFNEAANYILEKNAELYQRLS